MKSEEGVVAMFNRTEKSIDMREASGIRNAVREIHHVSTKCGGYRHRKSLMDHCV